MKIKHGILIAFMLLFLISSVSAADLNEMDYVQANDISDLNEDVVNLQDTSSNDIQMNQLDSEDSQDISMDSDIEDSNPLSMNSEELSDDFYNSDGDNLNLDNSAAQDLDDVVFDDQISDNPVILNDGENDNPTDTGNDNQNNHLVVNSSALSFGLDLDDIINKNNPLFAVVDFGSNTIHMEIYELTKKSKIKSIVSISEPSVTASYCENNKLTSEGIDELISIYEDFIDIMDIVDAKTRYFFATASLRKIDNCDEVIAKVKEELGVDINLISGEDEANLSFNSVKDSELTTDNGILIDLGGGSCEVIDFVNKNPVTMKSMPIGVSYIYNGFVSTMFPNETETQSIVNKVREKLDALEISNETARTDLFGVGGSVKAIKKVLRYLDFIDEDAKEVEVSELNDLLEIFKDGNNDTYQIIMNVDPDRINTFVPGLIITKTICDYFGIETLHFCKNGIREGIAQELVALSLSRKDSNMEVSDVDVYPNEDIQIPVSIDGNATGGIVIELNNMVFTYSIENGTALLNLPKLSPGDYGARVTYGGDGKYLNKSQKINIHVKSIVLEMYDMIRAYNSGLDYSVKLIDDQGNAIVDKLVYFTVGEIQYFDMTNNEGIAIINPGLNVGTYEVTVSSPLLDGNSTKTLKIVKRIENNQNINVYYNSNQKYKIKIIGDNGKAESIGKSVNVIIDKKQYTYKTDKDGFITIALSKNFKPAKHSIKIQYKGSSVSNTINVKHALSSKKTFKVKKSAEKIILKAKLTLNNKKAIKGKTIKFKFKGKTYKAKTNSKGIAKIALKKSKFKKVNYSLKMIYLKDIITAKVKIL